MKTTDHETSRRIAYAGDAIFAALKLDNAPTPVRVGSITWVYDFLAENADLIPKVTIEHLLGMLITSAFVRVSAVNAGHYGVPQFDEALAFCALWQSTRKIPASAYNACKSIA